LYINTSRGGVCIRLVSVSWFASDKVVLAGGTNTNYTCSYTDSHISILNVTGSKQFTMEGGVLKLGGGALCYFVVVTDNGVLNIQHVSIEITSSFNNTIYVKGGSVILEYVQMSNQDSTYWVAGLVNVTIYSSPVIVEIISCIFINCSYYYLSDGALYYKTSPIVCFTNDSSSYSITLNMSSSFFQNNYFHLNTDNDGGAFFFLSKTNASCLLFLSVVCFVLLFYIFCLVFFFFIFIDVIFHLNGFFFFF
jgi:hypothetical protein